MKQKNIGFSTISSYTRDVKQICTLRSARLDKRGHSVDNFCPGAAANYELCTRAKLSRKPGYRTAGSSGKERAGGILDPGNWQVRQRN